MCHDREGSDLQPHSLHPGVGTATHCTGGTGDDSKVQVTQQRCWGGGAQQGGPLGWRVLVVLLQAMHHAQQLSCGAVHLGLQRPEMFECRATRPHTRILLEN